MDVYVETSVDGYVMEMSQFRFCFGHRHLRNIDCLMAHTTCLVCFINTVNGRSQKKKKKLPWKTGTSSRHITNLKQSILTFDIYSFGTTFGAIMIAIQLFLAAWIGSVCQYSPIFLRGLWHESIWSICGLYYKTFRIVIYDRNDSTIIEPVL